MSARKTAFSVSAYSLDGNNHLADLQVFDMDIAATEVERQGIAAVSAYTQVAKRAASHRFEMVLDNSGAAYTNLDVSVWTPDGAARIGDLKSGSLNLTIPSEDGSGLADPFEYANVVGARRISIDAEMLVASAATDESLIADARSTTVSAWTMANVLLNLGAASFDLPMTLTTVGHSVSRDGLQTVNAKFALRGTPSTAPSGTTFLGVAFGGDALISLSANMGFKTWSGVGVVTEASLSFNDGALQQVSGTLALQGQPGWA